MRPFGQRGNHIPVSEYKATVSLKHPANSGRSIWELLGAAGKSCEDRAARLGTFDRHHEAWADGPNIIVHCVMYMHEDDLYPNEFTTIH